MNWKRLVAFFVGLLYLALTAGHVVGQVAQADDGEWQRLNAQIDEAFRVGDYPAASRFAEQALAVAERTLGPDHPNTLRSVNHLAGLYDMQRRYGDAEPLFIRALEASERTLGPNHPFTLGSVANLAVLYTDQARYSEAERLYTYALEARQRALGPDHPDTAISLSNLGFLYHTLSRFAEAEPLYRQALETLSRSLGPDHPDTLISANNLGALYRAQGRYSEAELLLARALAAAERNLAPDHSSTLQLLNNLGYLFSAQSRFGDAEPLYLRALEARQRTLRPDHPDTLKSINNLGLLYHTQGRYSEAEPLYLRALEARQRTLRPDHPDTLISVNNLGGLFYHQGRYGEAKPHFLRTLATGARELGGGHVDMAMYQGNFASILSREFDAREGAIYHAKKAVNILHGVRAGMSAQMDSTQSASSTLASFQKSNSSYALTLQSWLAASDRHVEAELVGRIGKLSDPELGVSSDDAPAIPLTPLEQQWSARFDAIIAQDKPIEDLMVDLDVFYEEIDAIPDEQLQADHASFGTTLQDGVQSDLASMGPDVAMVSIASFADETHFYLITPERGFEHVSVPVGEDALFDLIEDVRCQLKLDEPDRSLRTRRIVEERGCGPEAEDLKGNLSRLHTHLIAPIADKLEGKTTLILNLQGRLRYAPFAAFYDAEADRYLTERFRLSRFTWGDLDYRGGVDLSRAAGFGMSLETDEFQPLPGVERELQAVFGDGGPLSGTPKLNAGFTLAALQETLASKPSILHIASHFDMRPGQDAGNSYLLLGDKGRLTLKELNASPKLSFEGVDLLVLSACSTARATDGSGLEVEGLGAIAQYRGAEAVLATLWNVADASTAAFMTTFYTQLAQPGVTKAEALRIAQLELIDRDGTRKAAGLPDYSDPYHWAPYVLMGNWM